MHVDAKGAAVDLRALQVDEIDQRFRKAAFLKGDVDAAEGFVSLWRNFSRSRCDCSWSSLSGLKGLIVSHLGLVLKGHV